MAKVNGAISKTAFNLNTKVPMKADISALNTAISKLQTYVVNVENCGYAESCQTSTCQSCQSATCQSCQSGNCGGGNCSSNCNCCGSNDDGSNY